MKNELFLRSLSLCVVAAMASCGQSSPTPREHVENQGEALTEANNEGHAARKAEAVILVHGAWADGSSWSKVIPHLASRGHHVTAVQLPLSSVANDVATVARAIALESGPVVLVGHSYGGAVITEAGNDPKVSALVYVAAFAPDAGESVGSLLATVPSSPLLAESKPDAAGFIKITPKGIAEDFAQDVSPKEKLLLTATQGPLAGAALGTTITNPAWKGKPTWYIVATEDRAIPPALETRMASRIGAHTTSLRSSHVPMLSHPDDVARVIEEASE